MKDGIPSRVADAAVRVDTPPNARPYPYALSMTNVVVSIVWLRFNAALSQPDVNPIAQPKFPISEHFMAFASACEICQLCSRQCHATFYCFYS